MSTASPGQKKIINNMSANNMVIAAPGSGKSFTMIEGVAEILNRFPYARIGMVTFTRAAADSLSEKLKKKLTEEKLDRIKINTFHGFVKMQLDEMKWNGRLLIGSALRSMIHRAINHAGISMDLSAAEFAIDAIGRETDHDVVAIKFSSLQINLFNTYQKLCQKDGVADFNALSKYVTSQLNSGMIRPLNLTHLIVDEVQDTDSIQFSWISQHTRRGIHTSIVGDDDQAIYSFRSSGGVKIFQMFEKNFTPNVFYLNTCFRCEPEILSFADTLIQHNNYRYTKELQSGKEGGGKVTFFCYRSMEEQLQGIVELIDQDPYGWAILSRGNAHLDKVENILSQETIRYGGKSFWDEKESSDVLHLMAFFRHPYDKRLMKRVLALFGEDEQVLDEVASRMAGKKVTFDMLPLPEESSVAVKSIHKNFSRFITDTRDKTEIAKRIQNLIKWMENAFIKMVSAKGGQSITRVAIDTCQQWAERDGWDKMINRAAGLCLGTKKNNKEYTPDKVVLSTLHGSKGLEWKKVIILSCTSEQIPNPKCVGTELIEEERRLLYVGCTRAEKELYVLWYGAPSYFLNECAPEMVIEAESALTRPKQIEKND